MEDKGGDGRDGREGKGRGKKEEGKGAGKGRGRRVSTPNTKTSLRLCGGPFIGMCVTVILW
jgi:hypothetical protein